MRPHTTMRIGLLLVSSALLLGACGGGGSGSATDPDGDSLPPDQTVPSEAPPSDDAPSEDPPSEDLGGDGPFGLANLEVTVEHPDRETVSYRVACMGDTASITGDSVDVDEQEACTTLEDEAAVTRLVDGPPGDRMCTEIYGGPDVATVVGTIDDQEVDATVDRVDGCAINDWDEVLGGLLPPAVGVEG